MGLIHTQVTGDEEEGHWVKILLCGPAKGGKTLLAVTAPNPLIISAEGGLMSLRGLKVPYVTVKSSDVLLNIKTALDQSPGVTQKMLSMPYPPMTVVIDTLDEIQKIYAKERVLETGHPLQRDDWSWLGDKLRNFVKGYRDLPLHVVFTCHVSTSTDETTGKTTVMPMLQGSMKDEIAGMVDIAAVMQTKQEIEVVNNAAVPKVIRIMKTSQDPRHEWLGDRLRILPPEYVVKERKDVNDKTTDLSDLILKAFGTLGPRPEQELEQAQQASQPDQTAEVKSPVVQQEQVEPTTAGSTAEPVTEPETAPVTTAGPEEQTSVVADPPTTQQPEAPATNEAPKPTPTVTEPFSFACEECGTRVEDPMHDQWDLCEFKRKPHVCVPCLKKLTTR